MDMDDPWGSSPWADETDNEVPPIPKSDLEVKQTAPIRAPPLEEQAGLNSPWDDDDDGFGEWADVADLPAISSSQPKDNKAAGDTWGYSTSGASSAAPGLNGVLPSWGDAPEIQSDTPETLLSPSVDIARQSSPDPWATVIPSSEQDIQPVGQTEDLLAGDLDVSRVNASDVKDVQNDQNCYEAISIEPEPTASDCTVIAELGKQATAETEPDERDLSHVFVGQNSPAKSEREAYPEPSLGHVKLNVVSGILPKESSLEPGPLQSPGLVLAKEAQESTTQENNSGFSRPSSSPSNQSHHDEHAPMESARMSLDEDRGRPVMQRKVSKVQDLVQHFDEIIASQTADPPSIMRTPPKASLRELNPKEDSEDEADDFGDFGDFEEGFSDDNEAGEDAFEGSPSNTINSPAQPQTPQNILQDPSIARNSGPVNFDIDASVLNYLYPELPKDMASESIFIPDTVIHDTFKSVEERKAWHRISRFGTMRKHNTGDDENYRRVRWSKSQMRKNTLEIVARWMEEDRISGRVLLGGGNKSSSIFGWGDALRSPSPAPGSVTAQRSNKFQDRGEEAPGVPREWPKMESRRSSSRTHSRKRSSSRATGSPKVTALPELTKKESSSPQRQSSVKATAVSRQPKAEPQQPVADFGWNMPAKDPYGKKPKPPLGEAKPSPETEFPNFGWQKPPTDAHGKAPHPPVSDSKSDSIVQHPDHEWKMPAKDPYGKIPTPKPPVVESKTTPETELPNFGWNLPTKDAYGTKRKASIPKVAEEAKFEPQEPEPNFGWKMPPKDPYGKRPSISRSGSGTIAAPSKASGATRRSTSSGRPAPIKIASPAKNPPTGASAGSTKLAANNNLAQTLTAVQQPFPVLNPQTSASASKGVTPDIARESMNDNGAADDEDEWGEMVASPTVAAAVPSFPPLKSLRHKKSMTLQTFPNVIPLSPVIASPPPRPTSSQGHKEFQSLGTLLNPDLRSPWESQQNYTTTQSMENPIASTPNLPTVQNPTGQIASVADDPWASADFSIFDATVPPAPSSSNVPSPPKGPTTASKNLPFDGNTIERTAAPIKDQNQPQSHTSREEEAQEKVVRGILGALPDLSYMLR
ncbi:hypothetical protein BP5796_00840 [Coleophoma crateriformis]|uniref:Uncharacterized protein n=1 Tax=Coleophoma crateriformis TaxID=565419 RepID=A0A3D8T977_9HELO|nr:hypothetical protein BP5796_00840 [Coleophoma crateriformis]